MTDQSQELALSDSKGSAVAHSNSHNLLGMVIEAARDPTVDAEKMQAMANLAIQLQDREHTAQFNRDLNAAKKAMPSIEKNKGIKNNSGKVQSRFTDWETLQPIVATILAEHNLTLSHEVGTLPNGHVGITPVLTHDNGMERRGKEMAFPPDTTGNKTPAQAVVSSSSYGQRVTTIKLLNIRTNEPELQDRDGNASGERFADAYDALPPKDRELVDNARAVAQEGVDRYADYFKGLPVESRGFLTYNKGSDGRTWHDANKDTARKAG